jgi:hypothetical protein
MSLLTAVEREAITDSVLKIQSIQASLEQVDGDKIPDIEEVHDCLATAHGALGGVLRGIFGRKPWKKADPSSRPPTRSLDK